MTPTTISSIITTILTTRLTIAITIAAITPGGSPVKINNKKLISDLPYFFELFPPLNCSRTGYLAQAEQNKPLP